MLEMHDNRNFESYRYNFFFNRYNGFVIIVKRFRMPSIIVIYTYVYTFYIVTRLNIIIRVSTFVVRKHDKLSNEFKFSYAIRIYFNFLTLRIYVRLGIELIRVDFCNTAYIFRPKSYE